MTTNSIGLKDECVFVQNTVLFLNPPYYSGDIKKKVIAIISKYQKRYLGWQEPYKYIAEYNCELNNNQ